MGDGLDQFTIPTTGTGYNYDVATSDGQTITGNTGNTTITFPAAGTYDIEITGDFPRIYFNNSNYGNQLKLTDVKKWGSIAWNHMEDAFHGCQSLTVSATDAPNLSGVTNMNAMFARCNNFNSNINHWDVSTITNIGALFFNCLSFNQPLDNWNVSNVTDFSGLFYGLTGFTIFNQDISGWNTSSATNMSLMFYRSPAFNQPIGGWDVSNVTNMAAMFQNASAFNQDISGWDVSSVTNMYGMFLSKGMSSYVASGTTPMELSFASWDVSNVTNMESMFQGVGFGNVDISNWNTQNVTNFRRFMQSSDYFNRDLSGWNTSSATNMSAMFGYARSRPGNISNWDIDQVTDFGNFMTSNLAGLSTADYDAVLVNWEAQLQATYPAGAGYTPIISINFGVSQYTIGGEAEAARTSLINTYGWTITDGGGVAEVPFIMNVQSNNGTYSYIVATNPSYTYNYNISTSDGQSFSNLTGDIEIFFPNNSAYYDIEITGVFPALYVNNVELSTRIIEIKQWGSQIWRTFDSAFYGCGFLANVTATDDPNTNLVSSMYRAFYNCGPIAGIDFSTWNTSNVTTFSETFRSAQGTSWHSQIVNWNTSKATSMFRMFANIAYNQDLSNWDVSSVTNFGQMFSNDNAIDQSFAAWDIGQATLLSTAFTSFITSGALSRANYDATLISWAAQAPTSNVGAYFGNSQYTLGGAAEAARNTLVNTYNWTITDGGGIAPPPTSYTDQLVASYNFDTDLTDYTGNNNGTTPGTITHTAFKVNNGADFSGSANDYVELPNTSDDFTFHDGAGNDIPFSISFWVDDLDGSDNDDTYFWVGNDVNTRSVFVVCLATSIAAIASVYGLIKLSSNHFISAVPCLPLPEKV